MRSAPTTLAVIGAGSIGGSWVALALAHGLIVHAADPDPAAESRLRVAVTERSPTWPTPAVAPALTRSTG